MDESETSPGRRPPFPVFGPEPLSPLAFLRRSRAAYAERLAVTGGDRDLTYSELASRCDRLAGGLLAIGVRPGDRVSLLSPNTALAIEAHFGVPGCGAVLNALNTRLSAKELAWIVDHAGSAVMLVDSSLADLARDVSRLVRRPLRLVVSSGRDRDDYEQLIAGAEPRSVPVEDEWGLLSLNYTSGTTGNPKGVMYAHRGAYLQSLAMAAQAGLDTGSAFLWTLPMFHCNGWCFPWAVTAAGARHVVLPKVEPARVWQAVHEQAVTHFNAAPTVLSDLVNHPDAGRPERPVKVATGGAPPSPALLARLAELGIEVTHLYGLTETYGPAVICDWWPEWNALDLDTQSRLRARQGVANFIGTPVRVIGPEGTDLPSDGQSAGEVVLRGNNVMLGYYRDPDATAAATVDGPGGPWFRTGDIGVIHPDGYLELRDRLKDVIISGGENIASIEVEQALASHPAVLESAVVAGPDDRWGEVPIAYVCLKPGTQASEAELMEHVRRRIARFKVPKRIVFQELPKTATGKIQKYLLREQARDRAVLRRSDAVGPVSD